MCCNSPFVDMGTHGYVSCMFLFLLQPFKGVGITLSSGQQVKGMQELVSHIWLGLTCLRFSSRTRLCPHRDVSILFLEVSTLIF